MRTLIVEANPGDSVEVQGFVENVRSKKAIAFLVIKDITGKIQATIFKEEKPKLSSVVDDISVGSVVTINGVVSKNDNVKLNGIEIIVESILVESKAEALPVHDYSSIDSRLDYRWIDLRNEKNTLIFMIQTLITRSFRDFLHGRDFIEIHSPKLISTASESGSDVFEVKYFDRKAYLAQSPQFYKQMAMAAGFERVFEVGPVFRAEKTYTNKHTTEFTGFDLEISYIESYKDLILLEQEMIVQMLNAVKKEFGEKIKKEFNVNVVVPKTPFPIMKLSEVYFELKRRYGYEIDDSQKGDLTTDAERLCQKLSIDMFDHEFLFITDYDADRRAFYHMRNKSGVPQGYDLIWKGVEITTGAQREHRLDVLSHQAHEKGLTDDVKNYLQFFRYGCPPHGGFGMGLDRITMVLLNIPIKEVMFLFRGPNRLEP